jgi:hypothetical protein
MAVLNRNTHRLQYLVSTSGYEDENGDYHPGEDHWEGDIPCDAVPSGRSDEKEFEDGVTRKYSYEVYNLPPDCRNFTIGDRVKLILLGGIEREFEVKGFHRYQKQCKLWL